MWMRVGEIWYVGKEEKKPICDMHAVMISF